MIPDAPKMLDLIQQAYDAPNDVFFRFDGSILAFRGTEDVEDWIIDATVLKREFILRNGGAFASSGGKVHAGFLMRWERIRASVYDAVVSARRDITITGHSLGGAIAALCALDLNASGWEPRVVTFGAPRVGDSIFAAIANHAIKDYARVENWADPVPRVPSMFRWSHAGKWAPVGSLGNFAKWPYTQHHALGAYRAAVS